MTLTTLRDVPWARPWYERLGFRVLRKSQFDSRRREFRRSEEARGLAAEVRVAMLRALRAKLVTIAFLPDEQTLIGCWQALRSCRRMVANAERLLAGLPPVCVLAAKLP